MHGGMWRDALCLRARPRSKQFSPFELAHSTSCRLHLQLGRDGAAEADSACNYERRGVDASSAKSSPPVITTYGDLKVCPFGAIDILLALRVSTSHPEGPFAPYAEHTNCSRPSAETGRGYEISTVCPFGDAARCRRTRGKEVIGGAIPRLPHEIKELRAFEAQRNHV